MLGRFLKSLLLIALPILVIVNMAYAFNAVTVINPTSTSTGVPYTESYFGVSSLIDGFKQFASENTFMSGFNSFLQNYANSIQKVYSFFETPLTLAIPETQWGIILRLLTTIVMLFVAGWPVLMMFFYTIVLVIYVLCYAINIVLFVMKLMGGYYYIPLPNVYQL